MVPIRAGLRPLVRRMPWWARVAVALATISAGYLAVRGLRFEYHFQAARRAHDREAFEEAGAPDPLPRTRPPERAGTLPGGAQRRRSGRPDFAEEELTACDDLEWPADAVRAERALLAFQRGNFDRADEASLLGALESEGPDRFVILEALAQGYMRAYCLARATGMPRPLGGRRARFAGRRMRRGWVHERLDHLSEAEEDYRHVLTIRPDDSAARLHLAQVLLLQRKPAEAISYYEQLHARAGRDPAVALGLAQCHVALGHKDEARALLDGLVAEHPDDSAVLLERGKFALAEGSPRDARGWLRRAAERAPQSYEPHYQLFLCLQRLGETAGASEAEQRFKAIEADLKEMNDLTLTLQQRPADPELRFAIANVFLRRGEESEGAVWLESVVRLMPSHAKARQALVELYERTGKPRQARSHRGALVRSGLQ